MLHMFYFGIVGCSLTNAGLPCLSSGCASGNNTATSAFALVGGLPVFSLFSPTITTITDPAQMAFLSIPPSSAVDQSFMAGNRPASLRLWRVGTSSGTLVRPIYQLGIYKPALYTPGSFPAGSYAPSTPSWTALSNPITDTNTWTTLQEQTIPITGASPDLATDGAYSRGQLMLFIAMPQATGGATIQIAGGGWANT